MEEIMESAVAETPSAETSSDIGMNELLDGSGMELDTAEQTVDEQSDAYDGGAESEPVIQNQKDFNSALSKRLQEKEASVSRRYENSPEYILGRQMLQERMSRDNVSAEEAIQRIQNERIQQKANEYKNKPESFYEDYLRNQSDYAHPQRQTQQQTDNQAIAQQLAEAKVSGILPDDFEPSDITADFLSDVQEYGVKAAARIFSATKNGTKNIVSQIQQNRNLPKSIRAGGNANPNVKTNIQNMTSEQFEEFDRRISNALNQHKTVRF